MSGLDKIIEHIGEEAKSETESVLEKAKAEAERIRRDAEKKTVAECAGIAEKAEAENKSIAERGISSAELRKKQILLAKKQELINQTIAQAGKTLCELPDAAYFDAVKKLFVKNAMAGDGVISFNEADLKRLPADLMETLSAEAAKKNGSVRLSGTPADIDGGFLLDYGGISENCSFRALIDDRMELLQDKVRGLLFS